jgi:predicted ATP-grasp superfamily ATP-dependent carboligase
MAAEIGLAMANVGVMIWGAAAVTDAVAIAISGDKVEAKAALGKSRKDAIKATRKTTIRLVVKKESFCRCEGGDFREAESFCHCR